MGATESRQLQNSNESAPKSGYHVVRVAANSPAHLAGIEPFFDFCVGLDGVALSITGVEEGKEGAKNTTNTNNGPSSTGRDDALDVWKQLEEREGTQVTLNIWSSKRQELRDVRLIPSRSWSTSSSSDPSSQPSLLGLTLRPCAPHLALSSVWHILDILENSPAESAGLVPFGDYVIGWSGGVLRHEGDFYELVESHEGRPLRLYVYNSDYDHTREVIIVPNREWGGEGLLGCGVGFGLLHRIPRPQDREQIDGQRHAHAGMDHHASQDDSQRSWTAIGEDLHHNDNNNNAIPKSSTDPNLAGLPRPTTNNTNNRNLPRGIPARQDHTKEHDDEEEEEEDEDVGHTSGVTVSMRKDDDDEDVL